VVYKVMCICSQTCYFVEHKLKLRKFAIYVDSSYKFPSLVNISLYLSSVISSCIENVEVNLIK